MTTKVNILIDGGFFWQGFGKRRNGKVKHDVIAAKKIEQAFAKHGVRPCNVWGD